MMLPLIYSNVIYLFIFGGCLLAWCAAEFLGPARWRGAGKVKRKDRGSFTVLVATALLGLILYFLFPLIAPGSTITSNQPLVFFCGLALMISGVAYRWYAIWTLGRYFTGVVTIHADQQVVQHGPYKLVRHPSYSGAIVATFGIGLMMTNWGSLFFLVISLLLGLLYRIKVEEEALLQLGQQYREYMLRTKKRLIPYIF